jgi:hypothetical protein
MPMGLPQQTAVLVGGGPNTVHELHHPDGSRSQAGPADRQQQLEELTGHVHRFAAQGPFWPGDNLVAPAARASDDAVQAVPAIAAVLNPSVRLGDTGSSRADLPDTALPSCVDQTTNSACSAGRGRSRRTRWTGMSSTVTEERRPSPTAWGRGFPSPFWLCSSATGGYVSSRDPVTAGPLPKKQLVVPLLTWSEPEAEEATDLPWTVRRSGRTKSSALRPGSSAGSGRRDRAVFTDRYDRPIEDRRTDIGCTAFRPPMSPRHGGPHMRILRRPAFSRPVLRTPSEQS